MEDYGWLASMLGLATAIINRKRIVFHRHEVGAGASSPVTFKKRLKRLGISLAAAIGIIGIILVSHNPGSGWAIAFLICMLMVGYQVVAIALMATMRMWR